MHSPDRRDMLRQQAVEAQRAIDQYLDGANLGAVAFFQTPRNWLKDVTALLDHQPESSLDQWWLDMTAETLAMTLGQIRDRQETIERFGGPKRVHFVS